MSAQAAPKNHPAPAPSDVRQLNERIAATSRLITTLYERTREAVDSHDRLIEQRDQLLTRRDRTFVSLMEEGDHADALAQALTGDAPLPDKLAAGMRIVRDDDFEEDPDFAQHVVDQTTAETAEALAAARAHDAALDPADVDPSPLTRTEIDAGYEERACESDGCTTRFYALAGVRHCPRCIATAYQRLHPGKDFDADALTEHDANGDA